MHHSVNIIYFQLDRFLCYLRNGVNFQKLIIGEDCTLFFTFVTFILVEFLFLYIKLFISEKDREMAKMQ